MMMRSICCPPVQTQTHYLHGGRPDGTDSWKSKTKLLSRNRLTDTCLDWSLFVSLLVWAAVAVVVVAQALSALAFAEMAVVQEVVAAAVDVAVQQVYYGQVLMTVMRAAWVYICGLGPSAKPSCFV